jgi:hypothetical protein
MRRALVVTAVALAGCGSAEEPAQQVAAVSPTATAPLTVPEQPAPVTATASASAPAQTPAATATATATAAKTPVRAPADKTPTPDPDFADATPAPTATPLPKDAPTATPTPKPKPAKKNGPLLCLGEAKLKQPTKSGPGLWSASFGGPADLVAVDGPYPSPRDAQLSVESLAGVSDAEVGGNYVVSANVSAKVKATVHRVADCLDARDR